MRGVRLDPLVVDAGVGEQQRHLEVLQPVQALDVVRLELVARDDEDVVGQLAPIQVLENGEGVRAHLRQEWFRRAVEQLHRRDVRLKLSVLDQLADRVGVGHQRDRLVLVPQSVGVPDAVRTPERTPLNVVQAQAALAVLHDLLRTCGQPGDLIAAEQGYRRDHGLSPSARG